jgi:hypothetical protein
MSPKAITGVYGVDSNGATLAPCTILPTDIEGVSASGTNPIKPDGTYAVPVQTMSFSVDLGRTPVYELGRKSPYARFISPTVEVRTEIEVLSTGGDNISATEFGNQNGAGPGLNLGTHTIKLLLEDDTYIDVGTNNKCLTVSQTGGEAAQNGGNLTDRYTYQTYNYLQVYHPHDPSHIAKI